jgi:crossover junction endodeoxyribonuclease RuvC
MASKLIGIDPGLSATGIGVLTGTSRQVQSYAYGVIKTDSSHSMAERLETIYCRLQHLFADEQPDMIVIEDVFSLEKYPKSGIILGKVCGVILLAAHQAGTEVKEIAVREAKQILTGNGNAGKEQLEMAVRQAICASETIRPYHASDALGLALIGLFRYADKLKQRVVKAGS